MFIALTRRVCISRKCNLPLNIYRSNTSIAIADVLSNALTRDENKKSISLPQPIEMHTSYPEAKMQVPLESSGRNTMMLFAKMGIHGSLLARMATRYPHIISPTAIQAKAIPQILNGESLLLSSSTGSGKTLAVLLPLLTSIHKDLREDRDQERSIKAVILVPSRELGFQIRDQITELINNNYAYFNFNMDKYCSNSEEPMRSFVRQLVIGGQYEHKLRRDLKENPPCILVSTTRQFFAGFRHDANEYLSNVKYVFVDEADAVVKPLKKYASRYEIEAYERHPNRADRCLKLIQENSDKFQLIGVSATMNAVMRMWFKTKDYSEQIKFVMANPPLSIPVNITHSYATASTDPDTIDGRLKAVVRLFRSRNMKSAMTFIDANESVDNAVSIFKKNKIKAIALYEYVLNTRRSELLDSADKNEYEIIVANEHTARGIDIPSLTNVFIVSDDVCKNHHAYLHMSGRVGRTLTAQGHCISIVDGAGRTLLEKRTSERLQIDLQDLGIV